ncbi:hypothetical protein ACFFR3_46380 [Nonomuraea salmonea]|uniref:DUF222 domain-containing protein n=1 Tax=Nonomuraea salmonea TaxID=46181 RepID=A0ABV5P306_9ACTN
MTDHTTHDPTGYEADPEEVAAALADIAAVIDPMERFARAGAGLAFHEACAAELRQMREEMAARFNRGDYGPRLSYGDIADLLLPGRSRGRAQQLVERGRRRLDTASPASPDAGA